LCALVEADLDCGEVVVAATDGEAGGGDGGVRALEEVDELVGCERDLVIELSESWRDGDCLVGGAGEREEGVRREAGAGAVGAPLVTEETGVGIDVGVGGRIARPWVGGAVLRIASVGILGPEAVEDKRGTLGALGCIGVRVAELRGPGEIEEVVVEGLVGGRGLDRLRSCRSGARGRLGRWPRRRVAGAEEKKDQKRGCGFLLHSGRRIAFVRGRRQRTSDALVLHFCLRRRVVRVCHSFVVSGTPTAFVRFNRIFLNPKSRAYSAYRMACFAYQRPAATVYI
jgi:hypothetical protein